MFIVNSEFWQCTSRDFWHDKPLLLFNHQLTRPFANAKGSAKESSGVGITPVLSTTKFIHSEAKGEVNEQFGGHSVYLHELSLFSLFLFSSNIANCLILIFKAYQLNNLKANQLSIKIPCRIIYYFL